VAVIVGLACVAVITRSFFFISSKAWSLPHRAQRGLQYAPIAALSAVVVPEVVMAQGHLVATWMDARLPPRFTGARTCSSPPSPAWRCICRCTWDWVGSGRTAGRRF
jgi:uncharacterized membrane protein